MFGGIFVDKMLLTFRTSRNLSVVCPRKMSYISKAGCVSSPNLLRSVFTYGRMISLRNFKDFISLLQCFKLALKENPFGKWIFGRFWLVFPLYINCIGRIFFFHSDRKNGSDGSFIIYSRDWNVFCPFFSIVFEEIWTYFEGVWSKLITSDGGISYFSS